MKKNVFLKFGITVFAISVLAGCSKGSSNGSGGGQNLSSSENSSSRPAVGESIQRGDLSRAARDGNLAKVRELVLRGADINENIETTASDNRITPLMVAVAYRHDSVAEYLICAGATFYGGFDGWTTQDYMNYVGFSPNCTRTSQQQ